MGSSGTRCSRRNTRGRWCGRRSLRGAERVRSRADTADRGLRDLLRRHGSRRCTSGRRRDRRLQLDRQDLPRHAPIQAASSEEAELVREAWSRRRLDGDDRGAVTDEMIDSITLAGTPDEVRDRFALRWDGVYERTLLFSAARLQGPSRPSRRLLETFKK